MSVLSRRPRSAGWLFAVYALISLVPVVILGLVLAASLRHEAARRGLVEGRSEAVLVSQTAVQPLLSGRPLDQGLSPRERQGLRRLTLEVVARRQVLRLRVRDLTGRVVYADDGSGFAARPEDEALDAARGHVIARLTRLNTDSNDTGRVGVPTVEVYEPLRAGTPARRVGVLELYLPYAPISRDISAGLGALYRDLAVGLALLYVVLFAISASVSRWLRRESSLNAYLAHHDTLTELPNRTLFHDLAARAVATTADPDERVAMAIIDLDRFKDVNDTLGHHNGDHLLTEVARRVAANMRPMDVVARLGGDEFGVILHDAGEAESVLWRIREVIDREIEVSGLPLSVGASIGFVVAPDDGADVDTLLQRADVAMYLAKTEHAGVRRYDATLDHYDTSKLALVAELRHAIDQDQLVLHYQPQVAVDDGTPEAVETLVRWEHPVHGLLYPDRFLPLAEQTDVIEKLTDWVLRRALTQLRDRDDLRVAVNVSARSVGRMRLAETVIETLDELGVPATRLIVEVTETALLNDPERAAAVLARLADAGVRVSLDDFGRGQTSLGYLTRLPIHELKIDRSFVGDMVDNPSHRAIVRSIVDLGHNLGLRVVGEGVETAETLASLHAAGCDSAQGYFHARPMPLEGLVEWLGHDATAPAHG